jgi:hypothetical protein
MQKNLLYSSPVSKFYKADNHSNQSNLTKFSIYQLNENNCMLINKKKRACSFTASSSSQRFQAPRPAKTATNLRVISYLVSDCFRLDGSSKPLVTSGRPCCTQFNNGSTAMIMGHLHEGV